MKLRDLMVYVAGPITKGCIIHNVRQAHEAAVEIVKAGLSVYVPHASCFWGSVLTECGKGFRPGPEVDGVHYEEWMHMYFAVIRKCQVLLRLPGESSGADREVQHALELKIPIFGCVKELISVITGKRN